MIARSGSLVPTLGIALAAFSAGCVGLFKVPSADRIAIRAETMGGRQAFILENGIYRAVLVPEIARFPDSLVYKPTGHEFFAQPDPLDTPNDRFRYYGGIVDCLPWVSGKRDGVKLPDKGLLYSVPWQCATGMTGKTAWFEGTAEIAYQDPLGSATNRLRYVKRVTGRTGCPDIRLDQRIQNTGSNPARFTVTLHGRTSIAGYDAGDYLFVPGKKAYISYMHETNLAARGISPPQWVKWPLPEALEFRPGPEARYVFVFTPASWAAAGDDKTGEALIFKGGAASTPAGRRSVRMALFMTNTGYLIEPGLTSCIEATPEAWADPENTIRLEPGQSCAFSVTLTPRSGVRRADWYSLW